MPHDDFCILLSIMRETPSASLPGWSPVMSSILADDVEDFADKFEILMQLGMASTQLLSCGLLLKCEH